MLNLLNICDNLYLEVKTIEITQGVKENKVFYFT